VLWFHVTPPAVAEMGWFQMYVAGYVLRLPEPSSTSAVK
jgi:hypothetical protein